MLLIGHNRTHDQRQAAAVRIVGAVVDQVALSIGRIPEAAAGIRQQHLLKCCFKHLPKWGSSWGSSPRKSFGPGWYSIIIYLLVVRVASPLIKQGEKDVFHSRKLELLSAVYLIVEACCGVV